MKDSGVAEGQAAEGQARIEELLRIVGASMHALDEASTVEATLREVLAVTDFTGMTFLLKEDDGSYRLVAKENVNAHFVDALTAGAADVGDMLRPFEDTEDVIELRRSEAGEWHILPGNEPLPRRFLHSTPYRAAVWLPLRDGDHSLGFLCLGSQREDAYRADDLAWLGVIGRLSSVIIRHAQIIEGEKRREIQREREAAEMHLREQVMQSLGYTLFQAVEDPTARAARELDEKGLTERELAILAEIATGASNREIADKLYVSEHTVKKHLQSILGKLDMQNRVQAAVYAVEQGLTS